MCWKEEPVCIVRVSVLLVCVDKEIQWVLQGRVSRCCEGRLVSVGRESQCVARRGGGQCVVNYVARERNMIIYIKCMNA